MLHIYLQQYDSSILTKVIPSFLIFLIHIILCVESSAQSLSDYVPCTELPRPKAEIIEQIQKTLKAEIKSYPGQNRKEVYEIYEQRAKGLTEQIEDSEFISCPEIDNYLDLIFKEIIRSNPETKLPKLVLVSSNPLPNALCLGEGTIIVTLGLLRRCNSRDELAFVLSHELAHYQLDHVNSNIENRVNRYSNKELKKTGLKKDLVKGDINALSNLIYGDFEFNRSYEIEADSLGFLLLSKTSYNEKAYRETLRMLDSTDISEFKKSASLKTHFNFSRYPFKDKWLNKNEPEFGNDSNTYLFLNKDSLKTHPDIPLRIATLDQIAGVSSEKEVDLNDDYQERFKKLLDFEIVAATYRSVKYLPCLYYALKMTELYPEEIYFKKVVAHLLIDFYLMRKDHEFGKYIPVKLEKPTWLTSYVDFLNNVRMSEFGELAYHYIQNRITFDPNDEELYFLLWKASSISNRNTVSDKVKNAYLKTFQEGEWAYEMSNN